MAGLESIHGGVGVEQGIAVALLDTVVLELAFGVDGVVVDAVADDGARQHGEVTRGRLVLRVGQAGGVDKMRVRHAQALRFCIHQLRKALFGACHVLGNRLGRVVARLDDDAAQDVDHRGLAIERQVHARLGARPPAPGVLAYRNQVSLLELARAQRLLDDVGGHHLGERCRRQGFVHVGRGKHLPGVEIHQQPGFGRQRRRAARQSALGCQGRQGFGGSGRGLLGRCGFGGVVHACESGRGRY